MPAASPGTGAGSAVAQNHPWTCRPPERRPRAPEEARSVTGSPRVQVLTAWPGLPPLPWQREPRTHVPGKRDGRPQRARAPDKARPPPTPSLHRPPAPGLLQLSPAPEVPRGPPDRSTAAPRPPGLRSCRTLTALTTACPRPPQLSPLQVPPPSRPQGPRRLTCISGLLQEHVLLDKGEELALQDVVGHEEQQPQARVLLRALVAEDEEQVTQQDEGLRGGEGLRSEEAPAGTGTPPQGRTLTSARSRPGQLWAG